MSKRKLLLLIVCCRCLLSGFDLEKNDSYILAADRIPGFKEQQKKNEMYVFDTLPVSWKSISLDGIWKYKSYPFSEYIDYWNVDEWHGPQHCKEFIKKDYDFSKWKDVPVPWSLAMLKLSDGKIGERWYGIAYYEREVNIPDFKPQSESLIIKFHGAGYRTDLWINGVYTGKNIGPQMPFEFDISSMVKPASSACLLVKILHTGYKNPPSLNSRDVGITQPVELQLRPRPYASTIRIVPLNNRIEAYLKFKGLIANKVKIEAEIKEAVSGRQAAVFSGELKVAPEIVINIPAPKLRFWSPDDPFLYFLEIKADGIPAGVQRFGYRIIEVKTGPNEKKRIFINNKQFYMRAFQFNFPKTFEIRLPKNSSFCINEKGSLREEILAMKYMNINTFRPHAMYNQYDETFFNLCDEIGILVFFDWNGPFNYHVEENSEFKAVYNGGYEHKYFGMEKTIGEFGLTAEYLHNHPSLAFWSFGNELYDHLLKGGLEFNTPIDKYIGVLKKADLQARPHCASTGRPVYKHSTPVDFVSHHQYIGVRFGPWLDVIDYLKETTVEIEQAYRQKLPFVNMETGMVNDFRLHDNIMKKFRPEFQKDIFDKQKFIDAFTSKNANETWTRHNLNAGGIKNFLTDLTDFRYKKSYMQAKRYIEIFRMNRDITDGVSHNTQPYDVMCHVRPFSIPGMDDDIHPWPDEYGLTLTEPYFSYRTAFHPLQAFLDIENYHPLCGSETRADIILVNDTENAAAPSLLIQARNAEGRVMELFTAGRIELSQGEKKIIPWKLAVPGNWSSSKYTVELFLHDNAKKLSENYYHIYTLSDNDRIKSFPVRKTALYDIAAQKFKGTDIKTTKEILDTLKIKYDSIRDFAGLQDYEVLIIGANSTDIYLLKSGEIINKWLTAGGRLLMFEQEKAGPLPWCPADKIVISGNSYFMEIYYPKHPVFKGLEDDMAWESPVGGKRTLHKNSIDINDGFLALVSTDHPKDPRSMRSVINDSKYGKGEYFISMIDTSDRFNKDASVTRYVENLFSYILSSDISVYAANRVPDSAQDGGIKIFELDSKMAFYADISKQANMGFEDTVEGDKKGGWADFGSSADMKGIPTGITMLSGFVPFSIIDPGKNNGKSCIVLKGPKREYFPPTSGEIPVMKKIENFIFLHTLMWVSAKPGEDVLEYRINYSTGGQEIFRLKNKIDIADWWMGNNIKNSQTVYRDGNKTLYATQWENPRPRDEIKSIEMISLNNAIPVLIAVTGKKKYEENIDILEFNK